MLKRETGKEKAPLAIGCMKNLPVIPLEETPTMAGADTARQEYRTHAKVFG